MSTPTPGTGTIKRNAIIATVIGFLCGGLIPGVLGVVAIMKSDSDPAGARKFTKWAWIVFAIVWALSIALMIIGTMAELGGY